MVVVHNKKTTVEEHLNVFVTCVNSTLLSDEIKDKDLSHCFQNGCLKVWNKGGFGFDPVLEN